MYTKKAILALFAFICCSELNSGVADSNTALSIRPPEFVYCPPAKFANCTTAKCEPIKGTSNYSCQCFLDGRYSATAYAAQCVPATDTTAQSRYHPVQSYQECANTRTNSPDWAWCLGVSCKISQNGADVVCDCTSPPAGVGHFPYIVVTDTFLPDACKNNGSGEVWSSATPTDVSQITWFLQQQPGLQTLQPPLIVLDKDRLILYQKSP